MAEFYSEHSIIQLREANRDDLDALRKVERYNVLQQRRLSLCDVETQLKDVTLEKYKVLVHDVKQNNPSLDVLKMLKNATSTIEHIEAFFRIEGAFDCLTRVLTGNNGQKQCEAAACLTNLSCGAHKTCMRIAKGAGAYIVSFITGGNHFLQEQCAWAAGNIAWDCPSCYAVLSEQGLLPALLAAIKSSSTGVMESAVYAIYSCMKTNGQDLVKIMSPDADGKILLDIDWFLKLIDKSNYHESVLIDAALTVCRACYWSATINTPIIKSETVSAIILCLKKSITKTEIGYSIPLALLFIRSLGYLTTSHHFSHSVSLDPSFNYCLKQTSENESVHLKKEMLWVLNNISANGLHIEIEPTFKIIKPLLNPLNESVLQVLMLLCNLAHWNDEKCTLLQDNIMVSCITSLLNCGNEDIANASRVFLQIVNKT